MLHPSEAHYSDFARFAAEAAKRYPESIGFEVWNEANFDPFWGGDADPDAYSEMFKRVASAIDAAKPSMPVYTSGLSPHSKPGPEAIPYEDFIEEMYASGAAHFADGVAIASVSGHRLQRKSRGRRLHRADQGAYGAGGPGDARAR